jgi:hypothetical protein
MVVLSQVRPVKYIDYNSILTYDAYCQIMKTNPINPVALKKTVPGIESAILVSSIS